MTKQALIDKGIYWDKAWSLVTGCSAVSVGCDHCWSAAMTDRFHRDLGLTAGPHYNGRVIFREDRLGLPLKVKKPTVWSLWTDLFHEQVTDFQICDAFKIMSQCPQHTFLILTKRAERLRAAIGLVSFTMGFAWPLQNVWLGVSVETASKLWRIEALGKVRAAHRFCSFEPLLTDITAGCDHLDVLDWAVCGPETGPQARPYNPDWINSLYDQCQAAGVPFFDKSPTPLAREIPWEAKL